MVKIEGLAKQFGSFFAVKDFSLGIEEGEFVTLLGPSGSGKTTVLRMVAGLEQPTVGAIELANRDVSRLPAQKRDIGLVFQSYALFPNMTVSGNIAFPLEVRRWSKDRRKARVQELLELVGLAHRSDYAPDRLSGGEKQRVALARALSFHPPLLLLDEPLSALDAKVRQNLRAFLKEIQRTTGVTTLMVTHDQQEALELSDRVVVMEGGRVEQIGTPHDVYYAPQTDFAASFIGAVNVLRVSVLALTPFDERRELALVSWKGHTFSWLFPSGSASAGGEADLRIRPESIRLTDPADSGVLRGVVASVNFMGAVTRVQVGVADVTLTVDALSAELAALRHGDATGLALWDRQLGKRAGEPDGAATAVSE